MVNSILIRVDRRLRSRHSSIDIEVSAALVLILIDLAADSRDRAKVSSRDGVGHSTVIALVRDRVRLAAYKGRITDDDRSSVVDEEPLVLAKSDAVTINNCGSLLVRVRRNLKVCGERRSAGKRQSNIIDVAASNAAVTNLDVSATTPDISRNASLGVLS